MKVCLLRNSFKPIFVFAMWLLAPGLLAPCLWSGPSAWAYIPPSQFILKTWANKHSGIKSLRIKTQVTAYDGNKLTDVHFKELSIYYPDTQFLRSWALDDAERKLFYVEKKADAASPIVRLLMNKDWQGHLQMLKQRGIPVKSDQELLALRTEAERMKAENLTLGRWGGGIDWVMGGASAPAPVKNAVISDPQLWFEKDTFLPVRMIYANSGSSALNEVQMESYKFVQGFPYPRKITVLKKNEIAFIGQLTDLFVDSEKSASSSASSSGFTDVGQSISSNLRSLISSYYEQLR